MPDMSRRQLLKAAASLAALGVAGCATKAVGRKTETPFRPILEEPVPTLPEKLDVNYDKFGIENRDLNALYERINQSMRIKIGCGRPFRDSYDHSDTIYLPERELVNAKTKSPSEQMNGKENPDPKDKWETQILGHDPALLEGQLLRIDAALKRKEAQELISGFSRNLAQPAFLPQEACGILEVDFSNASPRDVGLLLSMGVSVPTLMLQAERKQLTGLSREVREKLMAVAAKGGDYAYAMGLSNGSVGNLKSEQVREAIGGHAYGTGDRSSDGSKTAIAGFCTSQLQLRDSITVLYPASGHDLLAFYIMKEIADTKRFERAKVIMTDVCGAHLPIIREQLNLMLADRIITDLRERTREVSCGWEVAFDMRCPTAAGKKGVAPGETGVSLVFALRRSGEALYRQTYFDQADIVICHDSCGPFRNLVDFLLAQKRTAISKSRVFVSEDIFFKPWRLPGQSEEFFGYVGCMCEDLWLRHQIFNLYGMTYLPDPEFIRSLSEHQLAEAVRNGIKEIPNWKLPPNSGMGLIGPRIGSEDPGFR